MDTFPRPSQRVQSLQSLTPPNTNPTNGHNPHLCTLDGHRCNQSKHIDPRKLVGLFRGDATRQPDGPTPYSKIRKTFRTGVVHWKTSRTMCDELGMDGTQGTTGEPTIYS